MYDMCIVDIGGMPFRAMRDRFPHAKVTRYFVNVQDTINRAVAHSRTTHVWVVFSCCNYADFDFDYEPKPWEANQIHCWASGDQIYGDTFLVPVQAWREQYPLDRLEYFKDIHYHEQGVPRFNWPRVIYGARDLTNTIVSHTFESEFVLFTSTGATGKDSEPALWGKNRHQLTSFSQDNSITLVPRCAKDFLKTQVYDYKDLRRTNTVPSQQQDIVFISYDEPLADENWTNLVARFPSAKRVHGVQGMENALKAAAAVSDTPWFYAVFAKTRLHEDWDFSFVPDRWQAPKQYIFNALNTSNGLCYGHMGIILYHKESVLNSRPWEEIGGMDFTMSFDTESIPLVSVYGEFAITPYHAWRTAFREVSKLAQWHLDTKCVETEYRLHIWRTHATGPNAEWVLHGAQDGAEFFAENIWNNDQLKQAFRWEWLKDRFQSTYQLDQ